MSEKTADPSTTTALTVVRLAAVSTVLAVALGSVVCATASGAACPNWPGCYHGNIAPGWQLGAIIEFTHRVVAIATGPTVLAAAVLSRRLPGNDRWVRLLPWVGLVGAIGSGFFGRMVILSHLSTSLGAVDLFCALTAMTVTAIAAVRAGRAVQEVRRPTCSPSFGLPVAPERALARRLAAATLGVLVAMHVSGIFAAGTGSYTRCLGWPLWKTIDGDLHPWLQTTRLGLAGVAAALLVATVVVTFRYEPLRGWGVVFAALLGVETVLGIDLRAGTAGLSVATAYSVTAVALLWSLALFTAVAGTARVGRPVASDALSPALR
jgi:cytochrome c oxidase assembly protein subunit 15